MDDPDLADRLAVTMWHADFVAALIPTRWEELGPAGQASYLEDAKRLLQSARLAGISIEWKKEKK